MQATAEGLWIADQITDDALLVGTRSGKLLRSVATEGENLSGITYGDGALWLASNGKAVSRPARSTDTGVSRIIKADPHTGRTIAEFPMPGGGGVHGIEWSAKGLWLTTLASQTLSLVDPQTWKVTRVIRVPYARAHGLACDADGIWCVHTANRVIVRLDTQNGSELDRIDVPANEFEPHGLTIVDGELWSCDAETGGIYRIAR